MSLRLAHIAAVVWALGVLVMMLKGVVSMVRLRWLLRRCRVVDDQSVLAMLEACRVELGVRRHVGLVVTDHPTVPALAGRVRPRIILPQQALGALGPDELRWIFRHELAHVRRWDVAIGRLWWWARTLHWFNPLVWWGWSRARTEAELACDEFLLSRAAPPEHVGYGRTLLRVAELLIDSKPVPGTVSALIREPALTRRIKMIAGYRQRSRLWALIASTLLISLACVGLTDAVARTPDTLDPPDWTATETQDSRAAETQSSRATQTADSPAAPATPARQPKEEASAKRTMVIRVVGPDGQPMPGARIHTGVLTKEPIDGPREYLSDARGEAVAELPRQIDILRIWARMDGHVPLFAQWWPEFEEKQLKLLPAEIPEEFVFPMRKGTVIGGVVKNEDAQPIEGVKVEVTDRSVGMEEQSTVRPCDSGGLATGSGARITDGQGRWTLDNAPEEDDVKLRVKLSHPDYIDDVSWGGLQEEQNVTLLALRQKTATIVMRRGIAVTGTITDPEGKPVPAAIVVWGDDPYSQLGSQEVRTDERGVYRFPPLPPGPTTVTVMAEGWAPQLRKIEITPENPPVDFQLAPGKTIRIRFVERSGEPIPKVVVGIDRWRGVKSLYNNKHSNVLDTKIPRQANNRGVFEWTWAPEDAVVYSFCRPGHRGMSPRRTLTADGVEHEFVLGSARPYFFVP